MPSTLADFNSTTRQLRPDIRVDLALDATVESQTDFLDNYTILENVDGISGIKEMTLDAAFFVPNPSVNWARKGRTVEADILISSDDWVSTYTAPLFRGSTSRQNTLPLRELKIKASSSNSDWLDLKASRQVFLNQDISAIIQSLLVEVGVNIANISLASTGVVLPVYVISDNISIREYISDLAKGALIVVGFNRSGVFTRSTLTPIDYTGNAFTADVTVNLDSTLNFRSRDIEGRYYYNRLIGRGATLRHISNSQLDYKSELTGYEILPGGKLYFTYEIPETVPLEIKPFVGINPGNLLISFGYQLNSFFAFHTSDDGNGSINNSTIVVNSQTIARDGDKDVLLVVFSNTSASTPFYLRTILINGSGVQKTANLLERRDNDTNIVQDGKETIFELSSNAIQTDVQLANLLSILELNLWRYSNCYTMTIRGRPEIELGTILNFRDVLNNVVIGVVVEIDSEVSIDNGYTQEITAKTISPAGPFFAFDVTGQGFDQSGIPIY